MRVVWTALSLTLALAATPALAQPANPPGVAPPRDPLVAQGQTQTLTPHVNVIADQGIGLVPNIGIVVGAKAALVVDTGLGARNGERVLAEAQKVAPGRALYIVSTHFHPEHDLGAQAFPASAKMIRSRDQEADIAEYGLDLAKVFASRSPVAAELLKDAAFRKADITFETEHRLDLGGVTVRILAMGPNHTRGDTAVFVEPDAVLFSGDVAMKGLPAFIAPRSSLDQWLKSLDRFEALKPKHIVPSHGPLGDAAFITAYRDYLKEVARRTAEAKAAGQSLEAATATVTAAMGERYPGGRLAGAIRAAYGPAS